MIWWDAVIEEITHRLPRPFKTNTRMHLLTNVQRCEVEHIAGGVARYVGDAHEDIVIGPQLVLAVLQSAPAAGGPR